MADTEHLPCPFAPEVHQAEGVLSARLGIAIDEAVVLLRTYAEQANASLEDVALDVLAPVLLRSSRPKDKRDDAV